MIEVGEYVRTRDGQIVKLENNEEFYEDSVDVGIGIIPAVDGIWIDKEYLDYIEKEEIVKHSKNIIDLIEVGDYVNGQLIENIYRKEKDRIYYEFLKNRDGSYEVMEMVELKNIESILTKEQFEANCYKVKEE